MSTIDLGNCPHFGTDARYKKYRPWLERCFYYRICAYCLLHNNHLHIDHYEPQSYAPSRVHDPTNLLLACGACNGRGGKSDYHPYHFSRTRLPKDSTGYLVIDLRNDDFNKLFEIFSDGKICARRGKTQSRAEFNIALLNLQFKIYDKIRKENLETLRVAERTLVKLHSIGSGSCQALLKECLNLMVANIAENLIFFDTFGITLTPSLRKKVEAERQAKMYSTENY